MDNETIIRPIRREEWAAAKSLVYAVAHALMEPEISLGDYIAQGEYWCAFADLDDIQKSYFDRGGVFLVVEVNGRIVGTGGFYRYAEGQLFAPGGRLRSCDERLRTGEGLCEVRRVALLPEYRGLNLGSALMSDLERRARAMGYTRMALWTDPMKLLRAVGFYHRLGWSDLPIEGTDPDELWMGKDI